MEDLPQRKWPVHPPPVEHHDLPVIIFVTLCIKLRIATLDNPTFHQAFRQAGAEADLWRIGYYLIMPDHVHLFCGPAKFPTVDVKKWSTFLKKRITRHLGRQPWKWLNDCWDTQMRDMDHYVQKLEYTQLNPVRAGLVSTSEDWPYQGEIQVLW